jgi:uncharacterized protein (TIGR02996 family)
MAESPSPDPGALRPEIRVFLDEIKSHPDDDTPRLVLADWLQEHGDPEEAARGEMLRIQVLLHQLSASDPRREALRRRQSDLLREHLDHWVGPLMEHATWRFERGFLHLVARASKILSREAAALTTPEVCAWVETLKLEDLRAGHFPYLVRSPFLPHVHTLDLSDNYLDGKRLKLLALSPNVSGLKTLLLEGNRLRSSGPRVLADSPCLTGLTTLDLARNFIGDEGALFLADSPHLGNLTTLRLGGNAIGPQGQAALRQRFGNRVHLEEQRRPGAG